MNCPMVEKPVEFPLNRDIETEISYATLCDRLRPTPLTLPAARPEAVAAMKMRIGMESYSASKTDKPSLKSESYTTSKVMCSPSNDDNEDGADARLILRLASLEIPDPYVIPEERIRTPRTPRTPASLSSRSRRTLSPVDECRGGAKTPKDLLVQRYKSFTPRKSDFMM